MDQLLDNLRTPYWWISVVVIGLLLNIFSDYTRLALEKIFGKRVKRLNEQRQVKYNAIVADAVLAYKRRETRPIYKSDLERTITEIRGYVLVILGFQLFTLMAVYIKSKPLDFLDMVPVALCSLMFFVLAWRFINEIRIKIRVLERLSAESDEVSSEQKTEDRD